MYTFDDGLAEYGEDSLDLEQLKREIHSDLINYLSSDLNTVDFDRSKGGSFEKMEGELMRPVTYAIMLAKIVTSIQLYNDNVSSYRNVIVNTDSIEINTSKVAEGKIDLKFDYWYAVDFDGEQSRSQFGALL